MQFVSVVFLQRQSYALAIWYNSLGVIYLRRKYTTEDSIDLDL